jgi:hypothetical protein
MKRIYIGNVATINIDMRKLHSRRSVRVPEVYNKKEMEYVGQGEK